MRNFISSFSGNYSFLSNMYPCRILYRQKVFLCAESAFQAQKCVEQADQFCNLNGFQAKKLGKTVPLAAGWQQIRLQVMRDVVFSKFSQNKNLGEMLRCVPDCDLVEYNNWGDTFWGVDSTTNKGENHLGLILQEVKTLLFS